MNHQTSFTSICNIGFNLLNSSALVNVLQNLLVHAFNTRDNQVAASFLHQTHGLIIQIHTSITQPANLLIDTFLNHHIADFRNTLLINSKGIILKHDFFHVREVVYDILDFTNDIFRTAQTIAMTMQRLRINTEVTLCRAPASGEDLNRRESGCRENIISHTEPTLDKLCCVGNLIQVSDMLCVRVMDYFTIFAIS